MRVNRYSGSHTAELDSSTAQAIQNLGMLV